MTALVLLLAGCGDCTSPDTGTPAWCPPIAEAPCTDSPQPGIQLSDGATTFTEAPTLSLAPASESAVRSIQVLGTAATYSEGAWTVTLERSTLDEEASEGGLVELSWSMDTHCGEFSDDCGSGTCGTITWTPPTEGEEADQ